MVENMRIEVESKKDISKQEEFTTGFYVTDTAGDEFLFQDSTTAKHKTLRECMTCGKPFYGSHDHFYCPICAEDRKINKPPLAKICKDCGVEFIGYSNERRCPRCVEAALQESYRRYWDKGGTQRPMGSTDKCVLCGKEYTVRNGLQKYCSDECRSMAYVPKRKEHKKIYYRTSVRAAEFKQRRKQVTNICVYCLQPFKKCIGSPTNVCSDYCRSKHQKLKRYESYVKRGMTNNYIKQLEEREQYREQVKKESIAKEME